MSHHQDSLFTRISIYLNEMDLESQRKVGLYFKVVIVAVAVSFVTTQLISFAIAQLFEHFSICVYSTLASMVFCLVFMVPAWPMWKKHSLTFQKPEEPPKPQPTEEATPSEGEPLLKKQ